MRISTAGIIVEKLALAALRKGLHVSSGPVKQDCFSLQSVEQPRWLQ